MPTEWRREICEDCNAERERAWTVRVQPRHRGVPPGFRVERRASATSWRTIAAPTRDVTLCLCDAP